MLKIHFTTFIMLLLSYVFNYHVEYIIFFFLVLVHELGHLLMIKLYRYKFISLTIMPFGCIIDYEYKRRESLLVSIAGILVNLLLFYLDFFREYNLLIVLINLIPIYPLDGYLVLRSLRIKKKYLLRLSSLLIFVLVVISIYIESLLIAFISCYLIYRNWELYIKSDLIAVNEIYQQQK